MYMDNKEQLIEAIDNYDGYSSGCRKVLKLLVELSIDDVAHISVVQLSKIALLSREMIYQALCTFQQDGFIELVKRTKGKTGTINSIVLKPNKLNQLLQFYKGISNIYVRMWHKAIAQYIYGFQRLVFSIFSKIFP
jgi:hypothetical protein